ncbi:MAG TPA: HAMP domain-containing sensor histidine kinase, partial [Candidatus Xenobia bacterium]|jgi:two-component system OmpR family sensor kinase
MRHLPLRHLVMACLLIFQVVTLAAVTLGIYYTVSVYLWRSSVANVVEQVHGLWSSRHPPPPPMVTIQITPGPSVAFPLTPPPPFPRLMFPFEPWDDLARTTSSASNTGFVRILDGAGNVLAERGTLPVPLPNPSDYTSAIRASLWQAGGQPFQVLLVPLPDERGQLFYVQTAASWQSAARLLEAMRWNLGLVALAALLMCQVVSFWLSDVFSRPLQRLAATASELASGDFSARSGLPSGRSEVFRVAAAFDRMAERLQSAFAAQKRFVADASHELKTPLTAIGGMAELLEDGLDNPAQSRLAVQTIGREVERMGDLVSQLLLLSRADQIEPRALEPVDLVPIVNDLVDEHRLLVPDRPINWVPPSRAIALATKGELTQVVRNLLDNAHKYSPAGSPIALACTAHAPVVTLTVSDRGAGIPAQDLPHIFKPFYRADLSRDRRTGGSGLGLAIVQALVERFHGDISVTSTVEVGTEFVVRLPAA